MAGQQIYYKIEGDANGFKQAIAEAEAAHKRLVSDLTRKQADIGALRAAQEGLAKTNAALDEARRKLEVFKRSAEIGGASGVKSFAADIKRAGEEVTRLSAQANAQRSSIGSLTQSLTAAGINTRTLATENARLAAQIGGANLTLNTRRQALLQQQEAANAASAATARFGASTSNSTRDLIRMAAELFALSQAFKGARAVIEAGMQLDALENTLLFALESSEAAGEAFGFLRAETDRLGISFVGSAKQFAQMNAAAVGTALEGEKVRDIFTAVSEAGRVMGLQTFQIERAFLALQQMISKGTVQSEELRQQLGEQLPGAYQIAARAMGVTTQELSKMLKAGEVVSEDFLPKFAAELRRTVNPALPAAMRTYAAEVERLKNAYVEFLQEVARSGALDALRGQVVGLTGKIREMAESGELEKLATRLADIIGRLGELLGQAAEFAAEHGNAIINLGIAYATLRLASVVKDFAQLATGLLGYTIAANVATVATNALTVALKAAAIASKAFPYLAAAAGLYQLVALQGEYLGQIEDELQATAQRERNLRKLNDASLEAGEAQLQTAEAIAAATDKQVEKDRAALAAKKALLVGLAQQIDRKIVDSTDDAEKKRLEAERAALLEQVKVINRSYALIRAEQSKRGQYEGFHTQVLKKELESQTHLVKAAMEAQKDEYQKAVSALESAQKKQKEALKASQQFSKELNAAIRKGQGEEAEPVDFLDVYSQIEEAKRALQGGDFERATAGVANARDLLKQLAESGGELPGFLHALEGEINQLAGQAASAEVAAAEANAQAQKDKLIELTALAKGLENIQVDADTAAAEISLRKLVDDSQAYLDANPVVLKVAMQKLADIASGVENAPKRAAGGPIFGPGTGTSDSILARLSHNEHVLTAHEVAMAGGHAEIYRLRKLIRDGGLRRSLPGFASGGAVAVGNALAARLPALAAANDRNGTPIHLHLDGQSFEMQAQESVALGLQKTIARAALMHGRRR